MAQEYFKMTITAELIASEEGHAQRVMISDFGLDREAYRAVAMDTLASWAGGYSTTVRLSMPRRSEDPDYPEHWEVEVLSQ